jgi:hypothetical protein
MNVSVANSNALIFFFVFKASCSDKFRKPDAQKMRFLIEISHKSRLKLFAFNRFVLRHHD